MSNPGKTPRKGDIVINPTTQRPVRVGSRTWLKLVKEGLMEGRYTDTNELADLPDQYEELPPAEVEQKIKEINKTLPRGTQAVRGRGKYAGKIVKRQKQPSAREMTEYTARTASRVMVEKAEEFDEMTNEDMEAELERMILEEMMGGRPKTNSLRSKTNSTPTVRGRPKTVRGSIKQREHEESYTTQQAQEFDEQGEEASPTRWDEQGEDEQGEEASPTRWDEEDFGDDEDYD